MTGIYPKRKRSRLEGYDYNAGGVYFITVCTQGRRCMLSRIVGTGVLDGPSIELTKYGTIAEKFIRQLNDFYSNICIDRYVIMPNHIHFLLSIREGAHGPSGTPVPTLQNSTVSRFISTFKRFCNKEYGQNIWQYRSHDHIIRNEQDYDLHAKYIHENPIRWQQDELYAEE